MLCCTRPVTNSMLIMDCVIPPCSELQMQKKVQAINQQYSNVADSSSGGSSGSVLDAGAGATSGGANNNNPIPQIITILSRFQDSIDYLERSSK